MKKKNRIGREMLFVLLLFFSIIILVLLTGSYLVHNRDVDQLYKEQVEKISVTAASLMDGDFIDELNRIGDSEEYQKLRETALSRDDPQIIEDYLREKGLYEEYKRSTRMLRILKDSSQLQYLYVQDLGDDDDMYLLDAEESLFSLGMREEDEEGIHDRTANVRVDAVVTRSSFGWLCTCTEPILASDGSNPAVVGADLDMSAVMSRRHRFMSVMILVSIAVLIFAAIGGNFYIRRLITDPISTLACKAGSFGTLENAQNLKSQVIELPDRHDDEIRDLYSEFRNMQLHIIQYMENLTSITEEKERIGTELSIANRIQESMLPTTFPAFPERDEFDVYALMKPAKSVAGDFYDFFLIDHDHLGIVMADVSGKGIPASLFMMMAKIIISSIAQLGIAPHEVLERSNERICQNNDADMFVTVWFGILTLSTGHVIASNAGHEYPALQNQEGAYELFHDRHGFVLGGMNGVRYKDYEFDLAPGQTLFLYTDGVPEATTAWNEQFGTERMLQALNRKQNADPQELVHYMLRTVDDFDGDVPQFDDITMLALRYKGPQKPHPQAQPQSGV